MVRFYDITRKTRLIFKRGSNIPKTIFISIKIFLLKVQYFYVIEKKSIFLVVKFFNER